MPHSTDLIFLQNTLNSNSPELFHSLDSWSFWLEPPVALAEQQHFAMVCVENSQYLQGEFGEDFGMSTDRTDLGCWAGGDILVSVQL